MAATAISAAHQRVRRFPNNTIGRDFVCGDLHGCFELIDELLASGAFDPGRDRLFAVGDLIHRGPQSARIIDFLEMPWFFAVAANHEISHLARHAAQAISWARLGGCGATARSSDDAWWLDLDLERRDRATALMAALPILIEIETAAGLVGIVHAEVPDGMSWPQLTTAVTDGHAEVICAAIGLPFAGSRGDSRERLRTHVQTGIDGCHRVFVGHSFTPFVVRMGNVYAIDTGAASRVVGGNPYYRLSVVDIAATDSDIDLAVDKLFGDLRTNRPTGRVWCIQAGTATTTLGRSISSVRRSRFA